MSRKPPDFELWMEVTKSVHPLPQHYGQRKLGSTAGTKASFKPIPMISAPHVHVPRSSVPKSPPPITGFDRRTSQRLIRGNVDIDGRIDLHGTGIEMARQKLYQFLIASQSEGRRTVLIITGKGDSPFARHTLHGAAHFHADERQGRLRRLVPEWLHEHQFRSLVIGYQPAHPKHGGGGAFYVKIRRTRSPT